ncbi:MAG: hypothetical protein QM802_20040 [Agriterribacter sp.]
MTHLSRTESGKFIIAKINNRNGRKLHTTETLNRKRTAINNMISTMRDDEHVYMKFQDNTGDKPVICVLMASGKIEPTTIKPFKPYKPASKRKK